MALEFRRCRSIRGILGRTAYPPRRLRLRLTAFLLLELSLFAALAPRWMGYEEPLEQLAALTAALLLALLAMVPVIRDWGDVRRQVLRDSDELARLVAEDLRKALDEELSRKRKEENQQ